MLNKCQKKEVKKDQKKLMNPTKNREICEDVGIYTCESTKNIQKKAEKPDFIKLAFNMLTKDIIIKI